MKRKNAYLYGRKKYYYTSSNNSNPKDCPNYLPCYNCPGNMNCHHCDDRWSKIPYPNETKPYEGIEKNAGTWTMNYFKLMCNGTFTTLEDTPIYLNIKNPCKIDFYQELKEVENVQANLTPCEIGMAKFWGTGVPVDQWTPIALTLVDTYHLSPPRCARILSIVQNVINDAFVITWFLKYCSDFARPVQLNRNLTTLLKTPKFPTYPSGHSVVSGAASTVLSYFFPTEQEKLSQLAEDASISRLYGGIHFRSDLTNGLALGRQLGNLVIDYISKQKNGCCEPIDEPITEFLNAPIMPTYC